MTWKRDIIECGLALVFALGVWWWIDKRIQREIPRISSGKSCSIVCGYWNKDGVLEIVRED